MNRLLRFVPFVLCNLMAPEGAQGGGGNDNPPPPENPPPPQDPPKPEGETMEAKLTSATGIISNLFRQVSDLTSRLSTSNNERTKLEGQFNAATGDLTKDKADHTATKGQLATANTQITGLTTERDNANKNVERLEKLCNLRGIDHAAVVPTNTRPEGAAGNVWQQYTDLRTQEKEGKVKPGSSLAFYQKNSKALHEYQNAHKTE